MTARPALFSASEPLRRRLDAVDDVRNVLVKTAEGNRSELSDVISAIPQFVVVGGQSAGKSSVLSRLSGVEFPTASTRCTLIATELQLRKAPEGTTTRTRVKLLGKVGAANVEQVFETGSVEDTLQEAQRVAQELVGADGGTTSFIETLHIQVLVEGEIMPNVTLVDLPGLLSEGSGGSGERSSAAVSRIVNKWAHMEGSLILFVAPLNQDYDTVIGKPVVQGYESKTVVVFTKVDLLFTSREHGDPSARLRQALAGTDAFAGRFVVNATSSPDQELVDLDGLSGSVLGRFEDSFVLGHKRLREELESRLCDHVDAQLPRLVEMARSAKEVVVEGLNRLRVQAPVQVMVEAQTSVRRRLDGQLLALQNSLRTARETLAADIKRSSYTEEAEDPIRAVLLEAGLGDLYPRIYNLAGGSLARCKRLTHGDLRGAGVDLFGERDKIVEAFKRVGNWEDSPDDGASGDAGHGLGSVDGLIQNMQGLTNTAHVGPHQVVEHFAELWADDYKVALDKASNAMSTKTREVVEIAFQAGESGRSRRAVRLLRDVALGHLGDIEQQAAACIKRLVGYNKTPLVFTTNEHYLTSNLARMNEQSSCMDDSSSTQLLLDHWRAYAKVQVKLVAEAASKDLIGLFYRDALDAVRAVIQQFVGEEFTQRVDEAPESWSVKREQLKGDLQSLDQALDKLGGLDA